MRIEQVFTGTRTPSGCSPNDSGNVRAALEKIIEKVGEVEVTSTAIVSAVQAYAKLNAQGQWIDRSENVNLNELFERMTRRGVENLRTRRRFAGLVF